MNELGKPLRKYHENRKTHQVTPNAGFEDGYQVTATKLVGLMQKSAFLRPISMSFHLEPPRLTESIQKGLGDIKALLIHLYLSQEKILKVFISSLHRFLSTRKS